MAQLYSSHPEIRPTLPAHTFTLHPHSINKVFSQLKIQFFWFTFLKNFYDLKPNLFNRQKQIFYSKFSEKSKKKPRCGSYFL